MLFDLGYPFHDMMPAPSLNRLAIVWRGRSVMLVGNPADLEPISNPRSSRGTESLIFLESEPSHVGCGRAGDPFVGASTGHLRDRRSQGWNAAASGGPVAAASRPGVAGPLIQPPRAAGVGAAGRRFAGGMALNNMALPTASGRNFYQEFVDNEMVRWYN